MFKNYKLKEQISPEKNDTEAFNVMFHSHIQPMVHN